MDTGVTPRKVKEWIGASPDARPPPHVRERIFLREKAVCHIAKRRIRTGEPWQLDHGLALILGGENRESNLFPVLVDKHKEKTKDDVAEKAKTSRKRQKHIGIKKTKRPMRGGGFGKAEPQRTASTPIKKWSAL